jgi:hypothetical protein
VGIPTEEPQGRPGKLGVPPFVGRLIGTFLNLDVKVEGNLEFVAHRGANLPQRTPQKPFQKPFKTRSGLSTALTLLVQRDQEIHRERK